MDKFKNAVDLVSVGLDVVKLFTTAAASIMEEEQQTPHQNQGADNQEASTIDKLKDTVEMVSAGLDVVKLFTTAAASIMEEEQQTLHQNQGADNQEASTIPEFNSQPNLEFYQNRIPSQPNGDYIENILKNWFGNYHRLKNHTGYIQWLFPNKEAGLNPEAFSLKSDEARAIRSDPKLRDRVRKAFLMILDLYGMVLNESNEFQLKKNDPQYLEHFISHSVSHMWVTRILKALKELGHKELMLPWLKFLEELIYEKNILPGRFRKSFHDFWLMTLDIADQKSFNGFY